MVSDDGDEGSQSFVLQLLFSVLDSKKYDAKWVVQLKFADFEDVGSIGSKRRHKYSANK